MKMETYTRVYYIDVSILGNPRTLWASSCSSNISSSDILEHMFTNMPKCDTVAREHDEHCEHASNMVSNTSNICSPEHMFSNMPEHAFCIWHGLDLGRFFFGLVAATSHDEIVALPKPIDEHTSNMARTCLEHGMAHAAPTVRTAECSFLPFDNYTI